MEIVAFLIAIGALAIAFFLGYLRGTSSPLAEHKTSHTQIPATDSVSPALRLQQLTGALQAIGDASAHPADLLENATYLEAIAILQSAHVPLKLVTDYVGGASWPLSTVACAALLARPDRAQASATVLAGFRHLRPWPMYHALRYFDTLDDRPPVGALVLGGQEWWAEHPMIPGLLAGHFATRRERGDEVEFGDGLARATTLELAGVETLLRAVKDPTADRLLERLGTFRRTRVDRAYLQTFGRFVEGDPDRTLLVEHDAIKGLLLHADACMLQRPPRSLLIVGEPRTGKSSFVKMLAMRLEREGWTVFEAGGAQLQAGMSYIGELEERLRRLSEELAAEKKVLWHAPDFLQLAVSGTHKGQSFTLLDQLLPAVAAGRIVIITETTPTGLNKVFQQRPAVRSALELIRLRPLADAETNRLAADVAARIATQVDLEVEAAALESALHLSRHYMGSGQMPGAVLDLLKLAAQRAVAQDERHLRRSDVLATMAQLSGMPQQVLDDRERVDLSKLRAFFSACVIGQDEAINAVVDRIAMLKAGLTDSTKPIGVFLFAGPTGTGKTELAKTLARFLFGSADRLLRLDMSEFQTADAMRKIIGDADGAGEGQALTDRVRKQPFSVVLLDEFEKAHPNAWDLFLQVFDDARLTDAAGQSVDFRHCIIILTSNLGSTIRHDAGPGFIATAEAALSKDRVMKAITQSFRPEFINRLDRIIVFQPLTRDHMRSIVSKELADVLERRGLRHREWAVEWEASALEFLLDKGFSPTMGARPLKRAIDEHLLAPLAASLVEHRLPEGDQFLFVRSDGKALQVEFVDPNAPIDAAASANHEPIAVSASALTLARMMLQPTGSTAERSALVAELHDLEARVSDDRWTSIQADLASHMQRPDFWNQPDRRATLSRFEVMDRVKAALGTTHGLTTRLERSGGASGRYSKDLVARLASRLFVLRHGIEDVVTDAPVEVVLAVQPVLQERPANPGTTAVWCERLLEMYRKWAAQRGMQLSDVPGSAGAHALLVISGFGAARLLESEVGLHILDYETADDAGRTVARVLLCPTPPVVPESPSELYAVLSGDINRAPVPTTVVRRYRDDPSPLVRSVRQGWRTGRADLVFNGHFDLMGDIWPATPDEKR